MKKYRTFLYLSLSLLLPVTHSQKNYLTQTSKAETQQLKEKLYGERLAFRTHLECLRAEICQFGEKEDYYDCDVYRTLSDKIDSMTRSLEIEDGGNQALPSFVAGASAQNPALSPTGVCVCLFVRVCLCVCVAVTERLTLTNKQILNDIEALNYDIVNERKVREKNRRKGG